MKKILISILQISISIFLECIGFLGALKMLLQSYTEKNIPTTTYLPIITKSMS
jgi:hypothetical protein